MSSRRANFSYQPAKCRPSLPSLPLPPPSLPPRPGPPGVDMHQYNQRWQAQAPQGDFTFRAEKPAGVQDLREYDRYIPNERRSTRHRDRDRRRDRRGRDQEWERDRYRDPLRQGTNGHQSHELPARWKIPHVSERALLKESHQETELDFAHEGKAGVTYLSLDEISDSEEAEMDISDSNCESECSPTVCDNGDNTSGAGPPLKRARIIADTTKSTANNFPRWSNPNPYTALPPPDESRPKKKDVVQLIRKARVQRTLDSRTSIREESDFIAFDDDEYTRGGSAQHKSESKFAPPSHGSAPSSSRSANVAAGAVTIHGGDFLTFEAALRTSIAPSFRPRAVEQALPSGPTYNVQNPPLYLTDFEADHSPSHKLGSRKRTIDDEIKPLPPLPPADSIPSNSVKQMIVDGSIVGRWLPHPLHNPDDIEEFLMVCPWYKDHSELSAPALLNLEAIDMYEYMRPQAFETEIRQDLLRDLNEFSQKNWPGSILKSFGSFQTGLFLPQGDMDVVLLHKPGTRPFPPNQCWRVTRRLEQNPIAHPMTIQTIAKAKVPLAKFVHSHTGLNVDISFDRTDGLNAINTLKQWKAQYPIMEPLVLIIKHFLTMRGLNEPVNGGIGGFSIICLVVSMLQNLPDIQAGNMTMDRLGELLVAFFRYYGGEFDFGNVAIQLNPPALIPKMNVTTFVYKNLDRISIIDPNNPANDIAGGSSNTHTVVKTFADAYRRLTARLDEIANQLRDGTAPGAPVSALACLFKGNYLFWNGQRERLRHIYLLKQKKLEQASRSYAGIARGGAMGTSVFGWHSDRLSFKNDHEDEGPNAYHNNLYKGSSAPRNSKNRQRHPKQGQYDAYNGQDRPQHGGHRVYSDEHVQHSNTYDHNREPGQAHGGRQRKGRNNSRPSRWHQTSLR